MDENYTHYILKYPGKWLAAAALNFWFAFFIAGLGFVTSLPAQNYFKKLEGADRFLNQRITQFTNGDLLIGDSSVEAVRTGSGGEVYLTRMDVCGNVEWTRAYRREEEYLELKDIKINEADEVFAYGSAYLGLDELIFFLKLDNRGNILQFRLFEPETVDHFSYNIDLKGGRLMAYGLILDFSTKKFGFVAMFDESLNFLWGKKFTPFSSTGGAHITNDNGFICRSGQYLFKLDSDGALDWATELAPNDFNSPVSGPVEVPDGYILQAAGNGQSFFYKVDDSGQFVWKSEQFPAKSFPIDMQEMQNGDISCVYSVQGQDGHRLCRLELSPAGQIRRQEFLDTDIGIKPGRVFQLLRPDGTQVISANPDPSDIQAVDVPGFLLQTEPSTTGEACFEWMSFQNTQPNQVPLSFTALDTVILSTRMSFINNSNINLVSFEIPLVNACTDGPEPERIRVDTTLACGENWTVSLPSPEFNWLDGRTDHPRVLSAPGTYTARNEDCGAQVVYEYVLDKPDCLCRTYLPTAFSPNEDGRNDLLELYTDCELADMEYTVFSRWGEKIFESSVPGIFWDGNYRGRPVPNGLYLVKINYQWLDRNGELQSGTITQSITLLK